MSAPPVEQVLSADIQQLAQLYMITDRTGIAQCLRAFPQLDSMLSETYDQLRPIFPTSRIRLDVHIYHEDGTQELAAVIERGDLKRAEAFGKLESFIEGWWLDNLDRAYGGFYVTVE